MMISKSSMPSSWVIAVAAGLILLVPSCVVALAARQSSTPTRQVSRGDFVRSAASFIVGGSLAYNVGNAKPAVAAAAEEEDETASTKSFSNAELQKIVTSDVLDNQFLVTGKLTPDIYLPTSTFTDEIDTYGMTQWQKGTQKLFVGEKSKVRLVGDVEVTPQAVSFRFDEDLMFRIPLRPTVHLTGKVVLERDPATGLISSYREFWDQSVADVLRTAKI